MRTPNLDDLLRLKKDAVNIIAHKLRNRNSFTGDVKTKFKGEGFELEHIRAYHYGDEVRHIDWNVTARTGKVHIREFVTEKENNLDIIIDISPHMQFASFWRFKYFLAVEIMALISFAAELKGEKLAYWFFGENLNNFHYLQGNNSSNIISKALNFVCEDHGVAYLSWQNNLEHILLNYKNMQNSRAVLFIITDLSRLLIEFNNVIESLLINIGRKKNIILVDIYDNFETSPPKNGVFSLSNYSSMDQYIDFSENNATVNYHNMLDEFQENLNIFCRRNSIFRISLPTSANYIDFMKIFLGNI
jgi:hypothetical protein